MSVEAVEGDMRDWLALVVNFLTLDDERRASHVSVALRSVICHQKVWPIFHWTKCSKHSLSIKNKQSLSRLQ
jgi:hypothetical protein